MILFLQCSKYNLSRGSRGEWADYIILNVLYKIACAPPSSSIVAHKEMEVWAQSCMLTWPLSLEVVRI